MRTKRMKSPLLLAPILLALLLAATLPAQSPTPQPNPAQPPASGPLVADVHAAPYRPSINYTVTSGHGRVDIRNATLVNLIDYAHAIEDDDGREDASIVGGPSWLDFDRFDVAALVPSLQPAIPDTGQPNYGMYAPGTNGTIRPVVERILEERFHLKSHTEDRPLPGYVVTVAKDGPRLADARAPTEPGGCQAVRQKDDPTRVTTTCTSETITQFLTMIGGTFRHPLLDRTGLTKPYDFTLRLSSEQLSTRQDTINAYIEELNKQLGIVMTLGDVPQPALVVDHVDRTPTANPPETAKLVPATPELESEVASIRVADAKEPQAQVHPTGSQIALTNFSLEQLVMEAWQLPTGAMLGNVPPWLDRVHYTILAKLPPEVDGRTLVPHQDPLDSMLRKLLTDRFQIQSHWGEQTADGYVLLAGTPKMKKADPASRTYCKYGPAEGEKDVRRVDSPFNAMFHCQNVTMAQFADLLSAVARGDIKTRVVDKTGLTDSYNFSLSYTGASRLRLQEAAAQAEAAKAGEATVGPVEGLSIDDAVRKELGVRLEKQPLPLPLLILDHIDQTPTEN
ncbi:MAG: TIGR03435 family protein [Acidobacteriaceae bacterium]|jgi:uncharacterized protein (TIGR03435 family)